MSYCSLYSFDRNENESFLNALIYNEITTNEFLSMFLFQLKL